MSLWIQKQPICTLGWAKPFIPRLLILHNKAFIGSLNTITAQFKELLAKFRHVHQLKQALLPLYELYYSHVEWESLCLEVSYHAAKG